MSVSGESDHISGNKLTPKCSPLLSIIYFLIRLEIFQEQWHSFFFLFLLVVLHYISRLYVCAAPVPLTYCHFQNNVIFEATTHTLRIFRQKKVLNHLQDSNGTLKAVSLILITINYGIRHSDISFWRWGHPREGWVKGFPWSIPTLTF